MTSNLSLDNIVLSDEQQSFIDVFNQGSNIILSAPAGSGKSTVINYIRNKLVEEDKLGTVAFTSSTAISALLINGSTLHSFLGIGLGDGSVKDWLRYSNRFAVKAKGELLASRAIKTIIIDEFSMISAEFIETMDIFLRLKINKSYSTGKEFGGIQIILIGDIFQLDTVKGRGIIYSEVFRKYNWRYVTFTRIHRQAGDSMLATVINKIKFNTFEEEDILQFKCVDKNVVGEMSTEIIQNYTFLVSTNEEVDRYNSIMISRLVGESGISMGNKVEMVEFKPVIIKTSAKKSAPEPVKLMVGCKVLITYNISPELCNGRACIIISIDKKEKNVVVKLWNNRGEKAPSYTISYIDRVEDSLCSDTKKWKQTKLYSYMPLRVGYAITVHKSQGATLENVVLDINRIFSIYQLYVAISRVRKVEDLTVLGCSQQLTRLILLKTKEDTVASSFGKKEFFSKFIISSYIQQL